jgi:hypothetical protein
VGQSSASVGLTFSNTGNVNIKPEVYGDNLCVDYPTCSGSTISVGNQQYSTTSFAYGAGTALNGTPALINLNVNKPTTSPSNTTGTIFWAINIPSNKTLGTYAGNITIQALQN